MKKSMTNFHTLTNNLLTIGFRKKYFFILEIEDNGTVNPLKSLNNTYMKPKGLENLIIYMYELSEREKYSLSKRVKLQEAVEALSSLGFENYFIREGSKFQLSPKYGTKWTFQASINDVNETEEIDKATKNCRNKQFLEDWNHHKQEKLKFEYIERDLKKIVSAEKIEK